MALSPNAPIYLCTYVSSQPNEPSFSVTPSCLNEIVESPWLQSLGFNYMKQQPNWINESLPDMERHQIPVGGAVEFYCQDLLKRPKKDAWDDDEED